MLTKLPIPYDTFALATQFHIYLPQVKACLESSVLNVEVLVGAFIQQEKALEVLRTFV